MQKTTFEISKMDCPSEENLIRMKLDGISGIKLLDFDIPQRKLTVFHEGQTDQIETSIHKLNLGVIVAALLVHWLDSSKPDLIIGTIVFVLVIQGAMRILKLGK